MWLKAQLDAVDPRLFYLGVTMVVFLAVYGFRKLLPKAFEALPDALQSLPAILLGAVLSAPQGEDLGKALVSALFGALSGLTAVGAHVALKKSPLPYGTPRGEQ